jgi:DNA-binding response OmpR family regulator
VQLLPSEQRLFDYLRANPGRIISRAELAANVWKMKMDHRSRTIDQTVSKLRRKLEQSGTIITHAGRGYEFVSGRR